MAQRSASETSAINLFDDYLRQGVDPENAIELVRASLGLSRVELEDALRRAGRLNSGYASVCTKRQIAVLVDAKGAVV